MRSATPGGLGPRTSNTFSPMREEITKPPTDLSGHSPSPCERPSSSPGASSCTTLGNRERGVNASPDVPVDAHGDDMLTVRGVAVDVVGTPLWTSLCTTPKLRY